MKLKLLLLGLTIGIAKLQAQTLTIASGGSITTTSGATIVVQGSVQGDAGNLGITGPGTLIMAGTTAATINMNGASVPNLQLDNSAGVTLSSALKVTEGVQFTTNGKIDLAASNLILDDNATVTGTDATHFVNTSGLGELQKETLAGTDLTAFALPVGNGTNYRPTSLTTVGAGTNKVGVRNMAGAAAAKPVSTTDHLLTNWPTSLTTVAGTVTLTGTYVDADISGTEANLRGYYHNGTAWSSTNGSNVAASNTVANRLTATTGVLTGIDKFVLANAKVFLAGAFTYDGSGNLATTVMKDDLRLRNVIPSTSPYQNLAPYNADAEFTKVNNSVIETIANPATVLAAQAPTDNSIVDWVFLELRNSTTPGNSVLATRSALVQRDGDIVDVDGVSPVTFNSQATNLANGNYVLGVKHRNHHPIFTDLVNNVPNLSESPSSLIDLTLRPDAEVFGTPGIANTSSYKVTSSKNLMWGGNANGDLTIRYANSNNDLLAILIALGGNPIAILPAVGFAYHREDLNLDGRVRYANAGNDPLTLLQILGGNPIGVRTRQKPN